MSFLRDVWSEVTKQENRWILGSVVGLVLLGSLFSRLGVFSDEEPAACVPLSQWEIEYLEEEWRGEGSLTVEAAMRSRAADSDVFPYVAYVQASAPGIQSEVFTFATSRASLTSTGMTYGVDSITRGSFAVGSVAYTPDSTAGREIRAALGSSTQCLP